MYMLEKSCPQVVPGVRSCPVWTGSILFVHYLPTYAGEVMNTSCTWSPVMFGLNWFHSICTLFNYLPYAGEVMSTSCTGSPVMFSLNWFHSICTLFTYLCWRSHVHKLYLESCHVRFELVPFYLYTIYLPMLETRTWSPVMSGLNWFHSIFTLPIYLPMLEKPFPTSCIWSPVMFGLNWFHSFCTLFTYLCWRHVPGIRSCPVWTGSILFVHYLPTYAGETYLESSHVRFELVPFYLYTIYLSMLETRTWSPVMSGLNWFHSICTLFTHICWGNYFPQVVPGIRSCPVWTGSLLFVHYLPTYAGEAMSTSCTWSPVMSGLNWFHSICTLFTYLCWRNIRYLKYGHVQFELVPFYLYTFTYRQIT